MAVTETRWVSTTGDWQAAASWSDGLPSATVSAVFDGVLSNINAASGLDCAAAGAPKRLIVCDAYYGDIGGPGNALRGGNWGSGGKGFNNVIRGHGKYWLQPDNDAMANVIVDTNEGTVTLLGGVGAYYIVVAQRGSLVIGYGTYVSALLVTGMTARVILEADADGSRYPPLVQIIDGKLTVKRKCILAAPPVIIVSGGELIHTGVIGQTASVTVRGGILTYAPTATPGTLDLPSLFALSGMVNLTKSKNTGFTTLVIGKGATIVGDVAVPVSSWVDIDLREEYP